MFRATESEGAFPITISDRWNSKIRPGDEIWGLHTDGGSRSVRILVRSA